MEEKLIKAVYKRRAIWDPSNEFRRNSKILKKLWAEVAQEIDVDAYVAKNKWKNLRAYFVSQQRELEKPKTDSSGEIKTTCTWMHYNQLMFLKDVLVSPNERRGDNLIEAKFGEVSDQNQGDETFDDFNEENLSNSPLIDIKTEKDSYMDTIEEIIIPSIGEFGTEIKQVPENEEIYQPMKTTYIDQLKLNAESENLSSENEEMNHSQTPYSVKTSYINKRKLNTRNKSLIPENEEINNSQIPYNTKNNINKRKLSIGNEGLINSSGELSNGRRNLERQEEIDTEENPDLLFFRSLIPYMQNFTPIQKLRLRSKIQNLILLEYETKRNTGAAPKRSCSSSVPSFTPQNTYTELRPVDFNDLEEATNNN